MTHAGDLREAYLTLYGAGSLRGAAGIVHDVLCAQARKETISGRVLLVHWLGASADSVLSAFRNGAGMATEELLPLLVHPFRNGSTQSRVPDLAVAIEAAGLPHDLCDDDLAGDLQSNLAGPA